MNLMACGFLIQRHDYTMSAACIVCHAFPAVHIMPFSGRKVSFSLVAFKICYVTRQLCYSFVVLPFLRNMLDPPLSYEDSLHLKINSFYPLC